MGALCALVLTSATAHAGIQVPPITTLPAVPAAPRLWFDGSDATVIEALKARITHPRTAPLFNGFKAFVDGRLGNIGTADDDTRARFVKAAGLLHALGLTPPANTVASYRAAAVTAFLGVRDREAVDSIGEFITPPANAINVLQDASRLQSLAEGYDFLRGAGVANEEVVKMRAVLASWANAMADDWNLTGALGVPGHRDNWGIKGGAALITVALAMPEHADADDWLEAGMAYVNESLDIVAGPTGWYAESPWYLNYSLANLAPAAWHAKNAAGKDWFTSLRPFVLGSLAWRQPDGTAPPFEEGITNTFPWNTLASAYPDLASTMLWAWDNSPRNTENFENQAYHDVTRFLVLDLVSDAAPPTAPITRMLFDDTRLVALRAGWGANDLQLTTITARDHVTTELITSRHNVRNPLDLVVHGAGYLAMPTASGGPTVTTSANRASYLDVRAKNIPLVNGQAPFVVAASNVALDALVDSEDEGQRPNHFVDMARTTLAQVYADTREVSRLVAMIDRGYVVVLDRFAANTSRNFQLSWRGRGARTNRTDNATAKGFSWAGNGGPRLDVDVVGSGLATVANQSFYAPAWNQEETINGVLVGTNGANAAFITVMQVGVGAARSVTAVGSNAANVVSGNTKDTIVFGGTADGVVVEGFAAMVRRDGGTLGALAMAAATRLDVGVTRVEATSVVSLSLTVSAGGFAMEVAPGASATLTLRALPGIDAALAYRAFREGAPVALTKDGTSLTLSVTGGTYVVEVAPCTLGDGADPDGDLVCGASDNCPNVANEAQTDSDGDLIGDACECSDLARCDDQDPCTGDGCNPATGACTRVAVAGACDDGSVCTSNDRCEGGECVGTVVPCDDGNACTTDSCDAAVGCRFVGRAGACDDGDACTQGDACVASQCVGAAVACDDGNVCTTDRCEPAVGCVTSPAAGPCDDQDRCTRDDSCAAGTCGGIAVVCDDGNACTDEACDVAIGCVAMAAREGEGCDDENGCTSNDLCRSGMCRGEGLQCDDGNPCTVDTCTVGVGCMSVAMDDGACDDGDPCTDTDVCEAGVCQGASVVCDDDDPCTIDACDGGACVATPLTCADDEVCIEGDCVVLPPDVEPVEVGPEVVEVGPEVSEDAELVEPVEPVEMVEPVEIVEPGPDADVAEPSPDPDPSDATAEPDGLDFTDTGPQVIGGKDDGCMGGPASSLALLALGLAFRRRGR